MKRRDFALLAGAATAPAQTPAKRRRNPLMHVGGDYHSVAGPGITSKENLEYNVRHGVRHLTAQMRPQLGAAGWDSAELAWMKDDCDRHGVILEAIRMEPDYINLRAVADRDRSIETTIANLEKAAKVGVKVITYHWTVIPIRRNRKTPGRGGSTYVGFRLEDNWKELPEGKSDRVKSGEYWDRISYFLQKVIPAAKSLDVRLACHPYGPPGLPFGYQGADNWDSPSVFNAIKRYEAIVESPFNGFQLCLRTVAEGVKKPAADVLPIVRYLGGRGKIHQIHMRNIKGRLHDFDEVYPDEGEMDFLEIMRVLRDVQFGGAICPDHMPHHADDARGLQAFAFGYGYIRALIQAVNSEVPAAR